MISSKKNKNSQGAAGNTVAPFACRKRGNMAREFARHFYRSKEWAETRRYCLMRDAYLCQCCGRPAEEVHHKEHLTPDNINKVEVSLNPDNLVSLCRDCHFDIHKFDKVQGIKNKYNKKDCDEQFTFDEHGMLVRNTPPQK